MKRKQAPNIFKLATGELTQDSFFVWFLLWADQAYRDTDPHLNRTAQDFVRLLIGESGTYKVTKVVADRQLQNIDLWAIVNDEYFICIEDKTNTGAHSGQLLRYKEFALERCKAISHIPKFVYLKTGNESALTLQLIKDQGYETIDRKAVLQILNSHQGNNSIINDFRSYLIDLEELTASCTSFEAIKNEMRAAEGFYLALQELIPEWTDWKFVSNPTGGFLGFWCHWVKTGGRKLYIQIENRIGKDEIRVTIKIRGMDLKVETLSHICCELQTLAPEYGLKIDRPNKYRLGETSTLAIVQNAIPQILDDKVEIAQLAINLQNVQALLERYTTKCNSNLNAI